MNWVSIFPSRSPKPSISPLWAKNVVRPSTSRRNGWAYCSAIVSFFDAYRRWARRRRGGPRVRGRLGGASHVELPFRGEACDSPPVRMTRFRVWLRTPKVAEVAARVRELSERHQRVNRRRFATDDREHATHVSPTCTRSCGGTPSVPRGPSRSRLPSPVHRPRFRGRLGLPRSWPR